MGEDVFKVRYSRISHYSTFVSFLLSLSISIVELSFFSVFSVSFSSSSMAPKKAVPATSRVQGKRSDGSVDLSPMESRADAIVSARHESVLRLNYEISPRVKLFFQTPGTRVIDGGDITLYERMFLAGLRLPFPEIARDFVLFLMISPSQIMPNAWRYLFASYILWRLVLKKEMKIQQFFNIYRPRQTSGGAVELGVRHPPVFIKLKSGLTNNKFWEMQCFRVSGEWECPEGTLLPEDRRMSRTWQLLRPDRSDLPSLSASDLSDVKEISKWSAARVKAEQFEEVDFDNLVTEENMRQFLGYKIPRNKQLITKRGAVKKRTDAPPSPRPAAKKRPLRSSGEVSENVPAPKKRVVPLAASGARRTSPSATPPSAPSSGVNAEEGSASFRGFIPEVSPTPEVSPAPSFVLRDESGSEASFQGEQRAEASSAEPPPVASTAEGLEPEMSGEGLGNVPEVRDVPVRRRVKHPARKRKPSAQDRISQSLMDAELLWGKVVITPHDAEEVRQESLEEEQVGTPRDETRDEDSEVEGIPRTPSSERPESSPIHGEDREPGSATPQDSCSAPAQTEPPTGASEAVNVEEPGASRDVADEEVPGSVSGVEGVSQPEATPHLGVPEESRMDSENVVPEASELPETSARGESRARASTSGIRPDGSEAAPNVGTIPSVGPSSSSRVSPGFEFLGRGLLGHPMEAIKNLIPEGYLGTTGVHSPERIAQCVLISHYQVSF